MQAKPKKNRTAVWEKVNRDLALNLRELAEVSGYSYPMLKRINPPLVCGKIPYSDFRRFLRKLQDVALALHPSLNAPATEQPASPVAGLGARTIAANLLAGLNADGSRPRRRVRRTK
jgi:hypothetical protein